MCWRSTRWVLLTWSDRFHKIWQLVAIEGQKHPDCTRNYSSLLSAVDHQSHP